MRGEDHRAFLDVLEAGEAVGLVDEGDALTLQVVGRVRVVDEHPKHVHRTMRFLAYAFGDSKRIHDAVAVAARRDLEHFHIRRCRVYVR